MTGPPKLDSRITIGVRTKRGPISTRLILVSPGFLLIFVTVFGASISFSLPVSLFDIAVSLIWKHRIHILPSAIVKPMTWSTKGLVLRAPWGTPKVWVRSSLIMRRWGADVNVESNERIGREPFRQFPGKWSSDMVCTVRMSAISRKVQS